MEFRQLEVFAAVAEYHSFSEAARSLYLTQSTASSHMRNLEKELNRQLVIRSNRYLQLTSDGKRLLPYAKRILSTRDSALRKLQDPSRCLLHIGASTIPSGYLLPPIITNFRKIHPEVFFSISQGDSGDILELVLDGQIDLGFVGSTASSPRIQCIPFCEDTLVLATPANDHYLELLRSSADLKQLLKEPLILREHRSGTQKAADQFLSYIHVSRRNLNVIAEVNDLESIRHLLIEGAGITICSRFTVDDLEKQGLVILYRLPSNIHRSFYIAHLKKRALKPQLEALVKFTLQTSRKTESAMISEGATTSTDPLQ